ncbi:MAG: type II secretion system F family protein [Deltaproteobacteria bacterium]|nr:type II secretion system F family protein [Deltaproteobacteria bacterium]
MPNFTWKAKRKNGEKIKQVTEAASAEKLREVLEAQGLTDINIQKNIEIDLTSLPILKHILGGIDQRTIVIFTRQFSTMIDAGLALVQCLDILMSQQPPGPFKKILTEIKSDVESGSTFADALRKHPQAFDQLYANLCAAGEVGGILDTILTRLAAYMEKAQALRKKVKGAMTYPIGVLTVAIGVVILLMVKVMPTFANLFKGFGKELPAVTKSAIDLSNWFVANLYYIFAGIASPFIIVRAMRSNPRTSEMLDRGMLKIPLLGDLIKKVAVARFTRTLSTMISSGVPIMEALEVVSKTAGNIAVQKEVDLVRAGVSEGKPLAQPMIGSKIFPSMVVQMIQVGEQTGAMDTMLGKIADFYDEEVDTAVEALTSLMEPFIIVVLGGFIGYILIAMYMPVFSMGEAVN